MNRRLYLAAIGSIGSTAVAGCTDELIGRSTGENTAPADRDVPVDYQPADGDWIRRFGDLANNTVSNTATPPRSAPREAWVVPTDTPVTGLSSVGDTIFASTFENTHAISSADGEVEWTANDGGGATIIDGRRYVLDYETVRCMAIDRDEERWRYEFDERVNDVLEVNQTVYVAAEEGLVGLHPDTGERRWNGSGTDETPQWGFLGVGGGQLHWMTRSSYRQYRPNGPEPPTETGTVSVASLHQQYSPGPPVVADGRIYSGGGASHRTGVREIGRSGLYWYRRFQPFTYSPAVLEDQLIITGRRLLSDATESTITALHRDSKTEQWTRTVSEPVGYPVVANGTVLVGGSRHSKTGTGELFALDSWSGKVLWQQEFAGGVAGYELAVTGGMVVVGTREGVTALV